MSVLLRNRITWLISLTAIIIFPSQAQESGKLFTLMKPSATNVKFINNVRENDSLHIFNYEYLYNGHGIGIGDFNLDGLQDIFISGNTTPNKLFLNKGNLVFEDITRQAGVRGNGTWSTGVSIADVNGDGLPDIYVCHSGKYPEDKLRNELFINAGTKKGIPQFREEAARYGLDAPGTQSTQAAFFDYDRDGDLDLFLLNHSLHTHNAFLNTKKLRSSPDFRYGNRLFRNDSHGGQTKFTDVTLASGIINNPINYGLNVSIADVNQDGWPDIYTTSDYSEQDCYYENNGDGTFTQSLQKSFHHISKFSMGSDIADFNNDGFPDVFTLDMLPEDNHRQKLLKGPDRYDHYQLLLDSGFYRQHMRNMLHLNRGKDSHGTVRFSEIGQLAGVSNTDWSWAALFADLDCDGWKDLVVTNGYLREFTDMDFLKYTMADAQFEAATRGQTNFKTYDLVQKMPSNKLRNYVYRNNGDLTFNDVSTEWGLDVPCVSNAAAFADLDNDGDVDLVIGNNNEPVMIWRNNAQPKHWIQIDLQGTGGNTGALGAKIWLYDGHVQYQEKYPVRGFQSSVSPVIHFATTSPKIDSLVIEWPSGKRTVQRNIGTGKIIKVAEDDQPSGTAVARKRQPTIFTNVPNASGINFEHRENPFIDFKAELLMPYQLSRMGPALAAGDVNGDGNDDVYVGGALGQASELFLQSDDGVFSPAPSGPWKSARTSEDVNALFFDADNDGDLDLYVVSGGNEYEEGAKEFQDRLYLNNGDGAFARADVLPTMLSNKHAIAAGDFDGDGDLDLFVGGRGKPGQFPLPSPSYVLRNDSRDGRVAFTDITDTVCPQLRSAGMITVASWADLDGDKTPELIVGGDWTPIMVFKWKDNKFADISHAAGFAKTSGQWSALLVADIDQDGDLDLVAGNAGLNAQYKPSADEPVTVHVSDFDGNGVVDPMLCYFIQGTSYPMASRDELLDHFPSLRQKFTRYGAYADATLDKVFSPEQLQKALVLKCEEARTLAFINEGNLTFRIQELPLESQFSKTNAILQDDYDRDGIPDLTLFGNFFPYKTELGESDASLGLLLRGSADGTFTAIPAAEAGLFCDGDVRAAVEVRNANGRKQIVVGKNNDTVQVIAITPPNR